MARIELLSAEEAVRAAAEVGVPEAFAQLNVFRLLLRRPKTAKATGDLLISLLFGGVLDDRLRELVIMRIGWATSSNYEWTQHWRIALEQFGCTEQDLLALRDWQNANHFGREERAILSAVDETLATGTLSDATWKECESVLSDSNAAIELVAAIGCWRMISQLARTLEIPLEEGVASWPPDGRVAPAPRASA